MSKPELISFDYQGALLEKTGLTENDMAAMAERLESIRDGLFNRDLPEVKALLAGQPVDLGDDRKPLDAAFMDLPDRLLSEFETDRDGSELAKILATAKRIRESVDRVVVLGIGGSYMGARALMDACCEPYYNELSRADRGGRPRVYFEGNNVDNDSIQGLLHLLRNSNPEDPCQGRWAVVVISKSGGTIETAVSFRQFLNELTNQLGKDALPDLVVPVTGPSGKLSNLADAIGCKDRFLVPDGVGGRFSVLSAVGLLPASIMGIDIVALLQGAWLMNGHFQTAPFSENVVLQQVAINHLLETKCGMNQRVLSVWSKALETTGLWYDQLFAESVGKKEKGATPLTVVNTRDLHSRAQQHQEGTRDKVMNNIVVRDVKCDLLHVGQQQGDHDQLNELAEKSLLDLMSAAIRGTNEAYEGAGRPTTTVTMPSLNENAMGQLLQSLMLSTVVEGRLMGINPYGQPGVEMYKQNMNRILRES